MHPATSLPRGGAAGRRERNSCTFRVFQRHGWSSLASSFCIKTSRPCPERIFEKQSSCKELGIRRVAHSPASIRQETRTPEALSCFALRVSGEGVSRPDLSRPMDNCATTRWKKHPGYSNPPQEMHCVSADTPEVLASQVLPSAKTAELPSDPPSCSDSSPHRCWRERRRSSYEDE